MSNSVIKTGAALIIPYDMFGGPANECDLVKCFKNANENLAIRHRDWIARNDSTALLMNLSQSLGTFSTFTSQLKKWAQANNREDVLDLVLQAEILIGAYHLEMQKFASRMFC